MCFEIGFDINLKILRFSEMSGVAFQKARFCLRIPECIAREASRFVRGGRQPLVCRVKTAMF